MAKFPKWQAEYVPNAGGPLIVRQPNAGQAGAAMSQLGSAVANVGVYLSREAKEAAERTAELDRIRQSSTVTRQAMGELRRYADEIRRDPNPANYERRFEEVSQSILAGIDAIDDPEVKTRVQAKLDAELDFHYRDMLTYRMEAQHKAFESEYAAAEQEAVRSGNVELVEQPLVELVDAGFLSDEQAGQARRTAEAKTEVWQTALSLGWKDGQKYISDPATWKDVPLSPDEMEAFKGLIESNLRSQQAAEAREARQQQAQVEQARNALFADALADKLDDPATIDAALRSGIVTPAEAKQLYETIKTGAAEQSDPDVWLEALSKVQSAQRDPKQRDDALAFLRANVTKLTPANFQSLSSQAYASDTPDNPLTAPTVKLLDRLIDDTYQLGGFGEWGTPEAQRQYINAKERFVAFAQQHPDADDETLNAKYRELVEPVAKPTWLQRIRDVFFSPAPETWSWAPGAWAPMPPELPAEPMVKAFAGDAPEPTYRPADETAPPESLEEFERVLMSLPAGSQVQKDYYDKWASKWQ